MNKPNDKPITKQNHWIKITWTDAEILEGIHSGRLGLYLTEKSTKVLQPSKEKPRVRGR